MRITGNSNFTLKYYQDSWGQYCTYCNHSKSLWEEAADQSRGTAFYTAERLPDGSSSKNLWRGRKRSFIMISALILQRL